MAITSLVVWSDVLLIGSTAIHVDGAGEIAGIQEETDPVGGDKFVMEFVGTPVEVMLLPLDDDLADTVVINSQGTNGALEGGADTTDLSQAGAVGKELLLGGADAVQADSVAALVAADTLGAIAIHLNPK